MRANESDLVNPQCLLRGLADLREAVWSRRDARRRLPRSFRAPPEAPAAFWCRCRHLFGGRCGGVGCELGVDEGGQVRLRFTDLPECLVGARILVSFPSAVAQELNAAWGSGPRWGIVRVSEPVGPDREVEIAVATVSSGAVGLAAAFSRVVLLSESGRLQPDVSIRFELSQARLRAVRIGRAPGTPVLAQAGRAA